MGKFLPIIVSIVSVFLFISCVKDKEPDYGFVDVRNTTWEIKGNFNGNNSTVILEFEGLGESKFGEVSANWIQSGNDIMWLTADNKRFEGRLRNSFDMRGEYYESVGQIPLGSFTAKRK